MKRTAGPPTKPERVGVFDPFGGEDVDDGLRNVQLGQYWGERLVHLALC